MSKKDLELLNKKLYKSTRARASLEPVITRKAEKARTQGAVRVPAAPKATTNITGNVMSYGKFEAASAESIVAATPVGTSPQSTPAAGNAQQVFPSTPTQKTSGGRGLDNSVNQSIRAESNVPVAQDLLPASEPFSLASSTSRRIKPSGGHNTASDVPRRVSVASSSSAAAAPAAPAIRKRGAERRCVWNKCLYCYVMDKCTRVDTCGGRWRCLVHFRHAFPQAAVGLGYIGG